MKAFFSVLALLLVTGCSSYDDNRASIASNNVNVLSQLESNSPGTVAKINDAYGFAIFTNSEVNLLVVHAGSGVGTVYNNQTSEKIYMDISSQGVGVGIGGSDIDAVFVFEDQQSMDKFTQDGWTFSPSVEAKMIVNTDESLTIDGITVYKLTRNGTDLHAMLRGVSIERNDELNQTTLAESLEIEEQTQMTE